MVSGVRYRVSLDYKPTKKEAELLIAKRITNANPSINHHDTFSVSAKKYIQIKSNVLSPTTIRTYTGYLSCLSQNFLKTKTANITKELFQKEINDYSVDHAPKSVGNLYNFISTVIRFYNPTMIFHITLPQKRKYEAVTPSEDHVKKILSEVAGTKYEIAFRLAVYGMRRGEICALDAGDLDGNFIKITKAKVKDVNKNWIIKPYPKTTGSQRQIFIDDKLAELYRKQGYGYNDTPDQLYDTLKRICKRLNIPRFRFHDFRAYYASMAHAMGVPDIYIMGNGGWSTTSVLNRVYKRQFVDMQAEYNKMIADHLG